MKKTSFNWILFLVLFTFFSIGLFFVQNKASNETEQTLQMGDEWSTEETADVLPEATIPSPDKEELIVNKQYGFSYYAETGLEWSDDMEVEVFFSTSSLLEYAERVWSLNNREMKEDSWKEKTVSDLTKTTINGREAYQFRLTQSFSYDRGAHLLDEEHLYTFMETEKGEKIIIHYPTSLANRLKHQRSLSSFVVSKNLLPPNPAPDKWTKVERDLFSFLYPANLFMVASRTDPFIRFTDVSGDEAMRGTWGMTVKNEPFDAGNIVGMYGKIRQPYEIFVGQKKAYWYSEGDGGYRWKTILVPLGEVSTLSIGISTGFEDVYPLFDDEELIKSILDTFEFKETPHETQ